MHRLDELAEQAWVQEQADRRAERVHAHALQTLLRHRAPPTPLTPQQFFSAVPPPPPPMHWHADTAQDRAAAPGPPSPPGFTAAPPGFGFRLPLGIGF